MPKEYPFHSKLPGTKVHHNNSKCTEGNNIETYNRKSGTGGHRGQIVHSSFLQWSKISSPKKEILIPHLSASSLNVNPVSNPPLNVLQSILGLMG